MDTTGIFLHVSIELSHRAQDGNGTQREPYQRRCEPTYRHRAIKATVCLANGETRANVHVRNLEEQRKLLHPFLPALAADC